MLDEKSDIDSLLLKFLKDNEAKVGSDEEMRSVFEQLNDLLEVRADENANGLPSEFGLTPEVADLIGDVKIHPQRLLNKEAGARIIAEAGVKALDRRYKALVSAVVQMGLKHLEEVARLKSLLEDNGQSRERLSRDYEAKTIEYQQVLGLCEMTLRNLINSAQSLGDTFTKEQLPSRENLVEIMEIMQDNAQNCLDDIEYKRQVNRYGIASMPTPRYERRMAEKAEREKAEQKAARKAAKVPAKPKKATALPLKSIGRAKGGSK